jgi:hypothetical protein
MSEVALQTQERARFMPFSNDFKRLGGECADYFQVVQRRKLDRVTMNHIRKRRWHLRFWICSFSSARKVIVTFASAEVPAGNPVADTVTVFDRASNNVIFCRWPSCT